MNVAALPEHAATGTPAGHAVPAAGGTSVVADFAGLVAALFDTADPSSGVGAQPKPAPGDSRSPSPDPSLEALAAAAAGIAVPTVVPSTAGTTATAASVAAPEATIPASVAGDTRTGATATAKPTIDATAATSAPAPAGKTTSPEIPAAPASDRAEAPPGPASVTAPASASAPSVAAPAAAVTAPLAEVAPIAHAPELHVEDGVRAASAPAAEAAAPTDAKPAPATHAGDVAGRHASGEHRDSGDAEQASRPDSGPRGLSTRERPEPGTPPADAPASPRGAVHADAAPAASDAPPPLPPPAAARDAHAATQASERTPHDAPPAAPAPHDVERLLRVDEMRRLPLREDGEMRLQVSPEGLGPIEVRVAVRDDAVHASLVATHDHAREALEAHRGSLEAALGRSNLRLEGFSVGLGQERQDRRSDQGFDQAARREDVAGAPARPGASTPAAAGPAVIERAAARGLSLRA
jgi:flagellar hook-length control protein FliK